MSYNYIILKIILLMHLLIISFCVLTPFIGKNYMMIINTIIIPFILIHWITNNNQCVLTIIEENIRSKLTGKPVHNDVIFMKKLIEPVYDFPLNNKDYITIIYIVTILLWLVNTYNLYRKYINFKGSTLEFIENN
jgi:hypothetical protein